jgi:uncharacterized protein
VVDHHGRFVWYDLTTTDMEAAKAFYTKVMGWGAQDMSMPGTAYILFTAGQTLVCGLTQLPEDAKKLGGKPRWLGYIEVDDVDATADLIKRLGGAVHVPPTDFFNVSRFAVVADPQAATFGLIRWLRPGRELPVEPDTSGRVGWHELLAADRERALDFYRALFGWQRADTKVGATGTYQLFSAGEQTIGGMLTKPRKVSVPAWVYYFNVVDIDAAAKHVKAGGGQVLDGPIEVPDGSWILQCLDPQGAIFALAGKRKHKAIIHFEPFASRDPSDFRLGGRK